MAQEAPANKVHHSLGDDDGGHCLCVRYQLDQSLFLCYRCLLLGDQLMLCFGECLIWAKEHYFITSCRACLAGHTSFKAFQNFPKLVKFYVQKGNGDGGGAGTGIIWRFSLQTWTQVLQVFVLVEQQYITLCETLFELIYQCVPEYIRHAICIRKMRGAACADVFTSQFAAHISMLSRCVGLQLILICPKAPFVKENSNCNSAVTSEYQPQMKCKD